jgi:hypothetical protein
MAAVIVQSKLNQTIAGGSTSGSVSFDVAVTTGNAVIVLMRQDSTSTMTVSDATNGAYTNDVSSTVLANRVWSKRNVTGGFTAVSYTFSPAAGGTWSMFEVSGLDNAASVLTDTLNNSTVTNHTASTSGLTGTGFAVVSAMNNFTSGTTAAGSGWTAAVSGAEPLQQYRIGALSSNTGPWTSVNSVASWAVMAIFPEAATGSVSWMPGSAVSQGSKYGFVSTGMTP